MTCSVPSALNLPYISRVSPQVPFDLFRPFGPSFRSSEEEKAKGRIAEINNGRLAMLQPWP